MHLIISFVSLSMDSFLSHSQAFLPFIIILYQKGLYFIQFYNFGLSCEDKEMDQQFSTITISMPKVKISHLEKNTFIYEIDVATRWGKWHLQKKYSEFQDLHKIINSEFNDLPEFPSSLFNYFIGQTQDEASEYQEILQYYLQQTSKRKDIINSSVYTQFLQLDKHSPMMLARKPKFLHEFEMQERINDEGKVILDYYYDDQFIVFATGNDNYMQKFNAVVANTKFPWQEQQEIEYVLPLGTIQCWLKNTQQNIHKRVWARNYPIETRCFIFNKSCMMMIVGCSDGSIEIFKLIRKPRYIYYEIPKMLKNHEEEVIGLHLDEVNLMIYSASKDGWINITDANRGILVDSLELSQEITKLYGDSINMRLYVALSDGNIEVFQYSHSAKLRLIHSLSTPVQGLIKTIYFDSHRNYLFTSCYQTGEIVIFQMGKRGQQKFSKQIGYLKNKEHIVDMIWQPQKMELLVCTQSGQIFFWNTVKGQQIYMLKVFDDIKLSKCMYIREKNMIITASRGRRVKFWQIPSAWRDVMAEVQEQRQIEIRRKVENMYKVRQAVKRKQVNSDQDDLKGWHWIDSEPQNQKQ